MKPQQHTNLVQLLLRIPGVQNFTTRTTMLAGIPNSTSLQRAEGSAYDDISLLISQLYNLHFSSDGWALLIFLDNARSRITGTSLEEELAALQQQLVAQASFRPTALPQPSPVTASANDETIAIFYCYAPEDERYCKELEKQLAVMRRKKIITSYGLNIQIQAGAVTRDETDRALETADVVLLLVSPDFIASDRLYEEQVKPALLQREAGAKTVIPILVRDTAEWQDSEFGKLFALPRGGKPIKAWGNADAAFASIAVDIRRVVDDLRSKKRNSEN